MQTFEKCITKTFQTSWSWSIKPIDSLCFLVNCEQHSQGGLSSVTTCILLTKCLDPFCTVRACPHPTTECRETMGIKNQASMNFIDHSHQARKVLFISTSVVKASFEKYFVKSRNVNTTKFKITCIHPFK